uniref:Secreted protein n=1 Tax=Picea glauca TaxID=3330 RepID=A0A101LWS9_PICGL|nr:hypothetical protein ABT39_MTgene6267 [Picea glauca]QHR92462.1 hypothetical protein Q903MT_gene6508 [Picea sitchensis]
MSKLGKEKGFNAWLLAWLLACLRLSGNSLRSTNCSSRIMDRFLYSLVIDLAHLSSSLLI